MFGFKTTPEKGRDEASAPAEAPAQPKETLTPPQAAADADRRGPFRSGKPQTRILLNLKAITDGFPPNLRGAIAQPPGDGVIIAVPIDGILDQLSRGRVQISLAELRRVSPAHVFVWHTSGDADTVEIPLQEIVPKLSPAVLAGLSSETIELLEEQERKATEIQQLKLEPAAADKTAPASSMPPPLPDPEVKRDSPPVFNPIAASEELMALFRKPPPTETPVEIPDIQAAAPSEPVPTEVSTSVPFSLKLATEPKLPEPIRTEPVTDVELDLTEEMAEIESLPREITAYSAEPVAPSSVPIPLRTVFGGWPEAIREECASLPPDAVIEFPFEVLALALGRGLASFTWGQIRSWLTPKISTESMYDFALLSIPVKTVEPLFLAESRRDEVRPPSPTGENGEYSRAAQEIAERVSALNGVAGVIIVSQDGSVLASKLPRNLDADAVGVTLPEVFRRLNEITAPMRDGALQSVVFVTGDRPWQLLRAGNLFMGAMGRPSENLPTAQLRMLAAQLVRQTG